MWYWRIVIFGFILSGLLAGCSSTGGGASYEERDTIPPLVSNFAITPPNNAWRGGACQITVTATDNDQVQQVVAGISGPGVNSQAPLSSVSAGSTNYQGNVTVPPNTNGDGSANTYYVTVWALDASGNSSTVTDSLSFIVSAPNGPPVEPPAGW